MSKVRFVSWFLLAMASAGTAGCDRRRAGAGTADLRKGGDGEVLARSVFPAGRWRIATYDQLAKSRVWISHVVIMHRGTRPNGIGLRSQWSPDVAPDRSREDAYRIALAARDEARANPAAFADVARKYSDDPVTQARGGSLGGVQLTRLTATFVDALAALEPGQVSDVIETPMGFHVAMLRRPPPIASVAGARIVVRYQSTDGEEPSTRTRSEAMDLAASIAAEARSGADFGDLARLRSDNPDRVRGGAMGVWSTGEPEAENALAIEELARMAEGEVSDPIDSLIGFQVVKRTAPAPATEFAMRAIRVPIGVWSPTASEPAATTPALPDPALVDATTIVRKLRSDPRSFSVLVEGRCCRTPARWAEGHGDPVVTSALEKLAIGEVTPAPVRISGYYLVAERVDPDAVSAAPKPTAGIPSPSAIDLDEVIRASDSGRLAAALGELASAVKTLSLSANEQETLARVLEGFRSDLTTAKTNDARVAAYHAELGKLYRGLPESSYARVFSVLDGWATSQILTPNGT